VAVPMTTIAGGSAKRQAAGGSAVAASLLGTGVTTQQLLCGQTMLCGVVTISVTPGFVTVSVQGANGWTISSTAIFVGQVANGGFPGAVPGQYPIMATVGASNSFTTAPIAVPCAAGDDGKSYVVAVSVHTDSNGPGGGQTGWANGPVPFPLAKWGWYSNACVPCAGNAAPGATPIVAAGGNGGNTKMPEPTDMPDKVKSKVAVFSASANSGHGKSQSVRVTVTNGTDAQTAVDAIKQHLEDEDLEADVSIDTDGSIKVVPKDLNDIDDIVNGVAQLQEVSSVTPVTDSAVSSTNGAVSIAVSTVLLMLALTAACY